MKHARILTPTLLIGLAATLSLSCAHDDDLIDDKPAPLALCPPAHSYFTGSESDAASGARILTRAYTDADLFTPGDGSGADLTGVAQYLPYNKLYPIPINKSYTTIGAFLAQDTYSDYNTLAGFFQWKDENSWTTTVNVKPGEFRIFGYMPSNIGSVNAKIEKRTGAGTTDSWTDGATMTIFNLSTVTPADVCVVVGVLKADVPNPVPDGWAPKPIDHPDVIAALQQGTYAYQGTERDNYVYLLLDHLYTNINLELSVEEKYSNLRTIVLKEVYMKTPVRETVDAVITLGSSRTKPIEDIHFTVPSGGSPTKAQVFPALPEYEQIVAVENHGVTSVPGYFAPGLTTQEFEFEFHYDVYDKAHLDDLAHYPYGGNLVRKDCIAINKWKLPGTGVMNGKSFKVTATIRPTYLFMLSEPDLDNPTVELNAAP